jgi:hypothetical protein
MKLTKEQIKDILARAGKTFAQAFISAISVDSIFGVTDLNTLKRIGLSMLIAGVAAGISAIWNMIQNWLYRKIDEILPTEEQLSESIEEGLGLEDEQI